MYKVIYRPTRYHLWCVKMFDNIYDAELWHQHIKALRMEVHIS